MGPENKFHDDALRPTIYHSTLSLATRTTIPRTKQLICIPTTVLRSEMKP